MLRPQIGAVSRNNLEAGRAAADLLLRRLRSPDPGPRRSCSKRSSPPGRAARRLADAHASSTRRRVSDGRHAVHVDGKVALGEIAPVVAHQLDAGCPGVSALGLGGEAPALTLDERVACCTRGAVRGRGRDARSSAAAPTTRRARTQARGGMPPRVGAAAILLAAAVAARWARRDRSSTSRPWRRHRARADDRAGRSGVSRSDARARLHRAADGALRQRPLRQARGRLPPSTSSRSSRRIPGLSALGGHGGLHLPDELAAGAVGTLPGLRGPERASRHRRALDARRPRGRARVARAAASPARDRVPGPSAHYVRCVKELLVEMGLISTSATRIGAPPLSPASRGLLLGTARRTGLLGLE